MASIRAFLLVSLTLSCSFQPACALSKPVAHHEALPVPPLPDVQAVMTGATNQMNNLAAQAQQMQQQVADKQELSKLTLATQKAAYERKLQHQAEVQQKQTEVNERLRSSVDTIQRSIDELLADTSALQKRNSAMRNTLHSLEKKMLTAKDFLADTLDLTDTNHADVLNILAPHPEPSLENFMRVISSDIKAGASKSKQSMSLLELSNTGAVPPGLASANPREIVQLLSETLDDLGRHQAEGEAQLKAHFIAIYELGERRLQELLDQKESLTALRAKTATREADLKAAKQQLEETNRDLSQRMDGIRAFTKNVHRTIETALDEEKKVLTKSALQRDDVTADSH